MWGLYHDAILVLIRQASHQRNIELIASESSGRLSLLIQHVSTQKYWNPSLAACSPQNLIFLYPIRSCLCKCLLSNRRMWLPLHHSPKYETVSRMADDSCFGDLVRVLCRVAICTKGAQYSWEWGLRARQNRHCRRLQRSSPGFILAARTVSDLHWSPLVSASIGAINVSR